MFLYVGLMQLKEHAVCVCGQLLYWFHILIRTAETKIVIHILNITECLQYNAGPCALLIVC